jgi:paraquat-inducible protein A
MQSAATMRPMRVSRVMACHECDLLQREVRLSRGGTARCQRCGAILYRDIPNGLDRALAFAVAAAVVFVVANSFPIIGLEAQGHRTSTTLYGAVQTLHSQYMTSVAALVFVTTILVPALDIGAMLYLLAPLKAGRLPHGWTTVFRMVQAVRPWGMVEVFMLGTLVSVAKLAHLAHLVPDVGLWAFAALMVLLALTASSFDPHSLWERVERESIP